MMGEIIRLMRVKQWTKNVFCFAGLFFGGDFLDGDMFLRAFWVFVSFCLLSSVVYIFNDFCDRKEDRRHPKKKERPLARGSVSVGSAFATAGVLLVCGFGVLMLLGEEKGQVALIAAAFLALNVAYSLKLKSIPLADVSCIALGFVLRVLAGVAAIGVAPTAWILVCTYFLTLLVAIGKRRAELATLIHERGKEGVEAHESRGVLQEYTLDILDMYAAACAGLVVAFYGVYCVISREELTVILTIIPASIGVFRYVVLIRRGQGTDMEVPEEVVFRDRWLLGMGLVWGLLFAYALYIQGSEVRTLGGGVL